MTLNNQQRSQVQSPPRYTYKNIRQNYNDLNQNICLCYNGDHFYIYTGILNLFVLETSKSTKILFSYKSTTPVTSVVLWNREAGLSALREECSSVQSCSSGGGLFRVAFECAKRTYVTRSLGVFDRTCYAAKCMSRHFTLDLSYTYIRPRSHHSQQSCPLGL